MCVNVYLKHERAITQANCFFLISIFLFIYQSFKRYTIDAGNILEYIKVYAKLRPDLMDFMAFSLVMFPKTYLLIYSRPFIMSLHTDQTFKILNSLDISLSSVIAPVNHTFLSMGRS